MMYKKGKKKTRAKNKHEAWERLVESFDILEKVEKDGYFYITSKEIDDIGGYEPRLAVSYNTRNDLPEILRENKLTILPVRRGEYIIGGFDVFSNIKNESDKFEKPIVKSVPSYIQSIDLYNITSEAIALNVAHASGMIDDVLGEEFTTLALSGRMGSRTLEFKINNKKTKKLNDIRVENAQIEIDGSYEGLESLGIVEAKSNVPMEFMVRQLYYPYLYASEIMPNKKVKPIFFTYSKGIFSFHEFEFTKRNVYSSIRKVSEKNFTLDVFHDICVDDIMDIYRNTKAKPEPDPKKVAPFPQADYFVRIMDLLDYLHTPKGRSKEEITSQYAFTDRQADYYWNSLVYLGLGIKERGKNRRLNRKGSKIARDLTLKEQKLAFVKAILERGAFREYFEKMRSNGGKHLSTNETISIILNHASNINSTTMQRRALTVKGWVHWIFSLMR